jgi:peptide/nickel transport system substrate-binding protein
MAMVEMQTAMAAHNFTLALHTWSDVGADPDVFSLWHSSRADGGTNYAGLRDTRIDQLLSEAHTATDEIARQRLYADFQRRWTELVPSIPLYRSMLAYDVATATAPPSTPGIIPGRSRRFALLEQWLSASR